MRSFLLLTLICYLTSANSQEMGDAAKNEIVFHSVNVIPMDSEQVLMNQVVVVRNGRIQAIGDVGKVKYNKKAIVINAKGKYLMPGLAEMHAHVPPIDDLEPMKEVLMLFAVNGITSIRGMLGHPRHLELRSKINSGEIPGPHFHTSGPSLNGSTVQSAAQGQKMVREQQKAGYDFLKLHPGLSRENFDAIAETAKEVHIPFAGHVSYGVGVWRALDAGYETIDHLDGFIEGLVPGIENIPEQELGLFGMFISNRADTSKIPALMKGLREHNVWVVPTQSLAERWFTPSRTAESLRNDPEMKYMDAETLNNWVKAKKNLASNPAYDSAKIDAFIRLRRKLLVECNRSGVGLLLGCDAPQIFNVPGFSTHHELQYLVDAGLTPYEALKTGTVNAGAFYKRVGDMGVIKKGAVSDLILLNANPLTDISNTTGIAGVMIGNNWMPESFIDKTLKKLEKSPASSH